MRPAPRRRPWHPQGQRYGPLDRAPPPTGYGVDRSGNLASSRPAAGISATGPEMSSPSLTFDAHRLADTLAQALPPLLNRTLSSLLRRLDGDHAVDAAARAALRDPARLLLRGRIRADSGRRGGLCQGSWARAGGRRRRAASSRLRREAVAVPSRRRRELTREARRDRR